MAAVKTSPPRSTASPASSPEATAAEQINQPVQKRKGGRKPVYATQEERKMRNRAAQAGRLTLYTSLIRTYASSTPSNTLHSCYLAVTMCHAKRGLSVDLTHWLTHRNSFPRTSNRIHQAPRSYNQAPRRAIVGIAAVFPQCRRRSIDAPLQELVVGTHLDGEGDRRHRRVEGGFTVRRPATATSDTSSHRPSSPEPTNACTGCDVSAAADAPSRHSTTTSPATEAIHDEPIPRRSLHQSQSGHAANPDLTELVAVRRHHADASVPAILPPSTAGQPVTAAAGVPATPFRLLLLPVAIPNSHGRARQATPRTSRPSIFLHIL